jgi:hypothetical protein
MAKPGASSTALTKDAKAAIQLAFEDLGGLPRLVEWANNPANLSQFYTQIWAKIIPKDIKQENTGKNGGPMKMVLTWDDTSNDSSDCIDCVDED